VARVALILRYQWRGFWRRILRRSQIRFYPIVLALGGSVMAFRLPALLSDASKELAAGRTTSMQQTLIGLCLVWLVVLAEGRNGSVTIERLRRFPLDVPSLVAIRVLSMWLSPIVWMVTIASLLSLLPFLSARHPVSGSLAALSLYAVTVGLGMSVSVLRPVRSTGTAATLGIAAAIAGLAIVRYEWSPHLRAGLAMMNPAAVVTTAAIATAPVDIIGSLGILVLAGGIVWRALLWAFPRSLDAEAARPSARRSRRVAALPGRLGLLILKEHRSVLRIPDLWMGLVPVVVASAYSFTALTSSTLRLSAIALTCALNLNLTSNSFGLERPAELTRYLILPIRGRDLLLAKNVGIAGALALQVVPLLAIGAWQGGGGEFGAAVTVGGVSLLGHLAWGNIVSVFEPRRAEPYRFVQGPDPVTALVNMVLGAAPGMGVIVLRLSASPLVTLGIAAIVLGTMTWYYGSLRYAGAAFERRVEIISRQLA
jgi:hypothetical protein